MKFDLSQFRPCFEAAEYYATKDSFEQAWNDCHRGDWMLWIAARLGVDLQVLTLAKGKCAETVIHLMRDERSKKAVEAAIKFGNGEISREDLNAAYADAYAAAVDADTYAAAAAAYAADAAAAAAAAYADAAAKKKNQQTTADICREILTAAVMAKI